MPAFYRLDGNATTLYCIVQNKHDIHIPSCPISSHLMFPSTRLSNPIQSFRSISYRFWEEPSSAPLTHFSNSARLAYPITKQSISPSWTALNPALAPEERSKKETNPDIQKAHPLLQIAKLPTPLFPLHQPAPHAPGDGL